MNGKDNNHSDSKVGEKVLKKLLDSGVPHDVTDKDGRQPLLWAASAGKELAITCTLMSSFCRKIILPTCTQAIHNMSMTKARHPLEFDFFFV